MASQARFPTTDEIKLSMETADKSIGAAEYLAERVRDIAAKSKYLNKNPELKENIIAAVDKFVDYVRFKLTINGQPWSGQPVENLGVKNMQNNAAEIAAKELSSQQLTDIKIDYAISSKGHYVRGYSSSTGEVSTDDITNLDRVFNAWLASNDYVIKGGYIYNAQDTVQSERTRINPEVVQQLMKGGGLEDFMANKGINVKTRERDYPGEEKAAKIKHEASAAVERAESHINQDEGPDVGPEAESSHGVSTH